MALVEQSAEMSVDALLASYATDLTVMPARVALDGGVVINEEIALDGAEEALMYKGAVGGGRPMMMMARGMAWGMARGMAKIIFLNIKNYPIMT